MHRFIMTLLCTSLALGMASSALAGGPMTWNRTVDALAVREAQNPNGGSHDVDVFVKLEASNLLTTLDLSYELIIEKLPGSPSSQYEVDVRFVTRLFSLATGYCPDDCDWCRCYPDGQTIVCDCEPDIYYPDDQTTFGESDPIIHVRTSTQMNVQPGDTLVAHFIPLGMPEMNTDDDRLERMFDGDPMFWDRRVDNVTTRPSAAGDSFFDIDVDCRLIGDYEGEMAVGVIIFLLINGQPVASGLGGPDSLTWGGCDGCGHGCAWDVDGFIIGDCEPQTPDWCPCDVWGYQPGPVSFQAIQIDPGDEIEVHLVPLPGALPELPGLEDDDRTEVPNPLATCPADCATPSDGFVNVNDLLGVLAGWGNPGGACDINDDGVIDIGDLLALLAAWGACFPV